MSKTKSMPLLDFFLESEEKLIEDVKPEVKKIYDDLLKPKYRPIGKYPTFMMVIKNPDGQEVSHWSCEEPDLEEFTKSSRKRGKVVESYPMQTYWEKYRKGDFQLK